MSDERAIVSQWLALEDLRVNPKSTLNKLSAEEKAEVRTVLFEIVRTLLEDSAMVTKYACFYLVNSLLWCCRVHDMPLLLSFFDLFDGVLHKEGMGVFFVENMAGFSHVSLDLPGDVAQSSEKPEESAEPVKEDLNGGWSECK